ncbi:MAG: hypothetical protein U1F44_04640 [Coriobacteriia bacterium]|nr:hypothetical protein [Coriobacteriia bacterium]
MVEDQGKQRGPLVRGAIALTWVIAAVVVLLVLVRVFIRPVSPDQATPAGHFGDPCLLCHIVSTQADIIDFSE